jgi:glycosyltransferase involved in cell wall biosynthesis
MGTPLISIIIPALNEEKFLPHLLESLTQQTDRDFEVIVVDGKSKDKTVEKAKEFESKIHDLNVIVADHASLPYQRNLGTKEAKGNWFLFVDADSILLPYSIERIKSNIENNQEIKFFTTWNKPDTENVNDAILSNFYNLLFDGSKTLKLPVGSGPFTGVRRDIFQKVNGYDEEHPFLEDADFRNRIEKTGVHITIIHETLFVWSMRRMRKQGVMKIMQTYMKSIVPFVFFKTIPKGLKGYDMGGHEFSGKQYKPNVSVLNKLISDIKKLMKEVFE